MHTSLVKKKKVLLAKVTTQKKYNLLTLAQRARTRRSSKRNHYNELNFLIKSRF